MDTRPGGLSVFLPSNIDDGYLFEAFIQGVPGVYPDINFGFRPVSQGDYFQGITDIAVQSGDDEAKSCRRLVLAHVKHWDCMDGSTVAPINEEYVSRLPGNALNRMRHIILGLAPLRPDGAPVSLENEQGN